MLECGCGTGPGACFLAERGFEVDAFDLIPTAIEIARKIALERHLEIRYEVMDVCELPHEGKRYDLIVDSFCLQGIAADPDRRRVLMAVRARLKRDGYYLISTAMRKEWNVSSENPILDPHSGRLFYRYAEESLLEEDTGLVYQPFHGSPEEYEGTLKIGDEWYLLNRRHLTPPMLKAELEGAGFKVLYQDGVCGENAVCVLPSAAVSVSPARQS